jgi:hypothetical protein
MIRRSAIRSIALSALAALALVGCSPDSDTEVISAVLRSDETYQLDLVSGDEGGARVVEQARHFAVSEVRRDASTSWAARYVYAPAAGFVGNDRVELEVLSGSDIVSVPARSRRISVRFTVQP